MEPISAIVVAGGRSQRLGQDKRRLRLWGDGGPTLLEHTVGIAAQLSADVLVVLNDPEEWPALPGRLLRDVYAESGPLAGLYSGLLTARHSHALVLAADMPFLSRALLAEMLALPRGYDILAARAPQPGAARNRIGVEPLHAIYSRACLAAIRQLLEQQQRRLAALFDLVRVEYIAPELLQRHDSAGRALSSINTPEQLEQAQRLLGASAAAG